MTDKTFYKIKKLEAQQAKLEVAIAKLEAKIFKLLKEN
jgi:hypothetical protein